jgi:hypothetical protein
MEAALNGRYYEGVLDPAVGGKFNELVAGGFQW